MKKEAFGLCDSAGFFFYELLAPISYITIEMVLPIIPMVIINKMSRL
ncbi:hypothetical protein [Bacillus atrophaeus]|nr:hypothetical protein [Bacillus atrophaeus]